MGRAGVRGSVWGLSGHYQEGVAALEIHVKDQTRFRTRWAFLGFGAADQTAKPFPQDSACQVCHAKSGAVDETFVQFYPTLIPVAKAKGTWKPRPRNSGSGHRLSACWGLRLGADNHDGELRDQGGDGADGGEERSQNGADGSHGHGNLDEQIGRAHV